MQHFYTEDFFKELQEDSRQSAEEIVPVLLEMIPCNKLIDVGCGDGTWLKVFQKHGVKEILGIDGSYVNEKNLVIPKDNFIPFDLTKPLKIDKQFDIVMSLEVAEHLPAECAESFVDSLTSLGSVILFSAAIPEQTGENHINEQWQEYWAEKFQKRGYIAIDYVRQKIWSNKKVAFWYSQNILIFIQQQHFENNPVMKSKFEDYVVTDPSSLSMVHPMLYLMKLGKIDWLEKKNLKKTSPLHKISIISKILRAF